MKEGPWNASTMASEKRARVDVSVKNLKSDALSGFVSKVGVVLLSKSKFSNTLHYVIENF